MRLMKNVGDSFAKISTKKADVDAVSSPRSYMYIAITSESLIAIFIPNNQYRPSSHSVVLHNDLASLNIETHFNGSEVVGCYLVLVQKWLCTDGGKPNLSSERFECIVTFF